MPTILNDRTVSSEQDGVPSVSPELALTAPPWVQRNPRQESARPRPRSGTGERVVINYSTMQPAVPRPIRVRHQRSLEEVLKRAAASVEQKGKRLNLGRFNPLPQGRPLTRFEKILGGMFAAAFSLAVWLCALPEPGSAHTSYYQSLAQTAGRDAPSVQAFTETALGAIGKEWKAPVLFAHAHPLFWRRAPAITPNALVQRMEAALAALAAHGPVLSVTVFGMPALGTMDRGDGTAAVTSRVAGQVELSDGTVVRLRALLIRDEKTKQWGIVELTLPPFLP